jgi:cytochrome oxidase assembly protein ShyY1
MTAARSRLRNSIVVSVLFAVTAVVLFLALGTWQVERKAWKENLIRTMNERISAAPIDLPARAAWPQLDAAQDEFRHVRFSATFVPETGTLVYADVPASHGDTPGYWVFALARTQNGDNIVVNRGFVPDTRKDVMQEAAPSGKVAMLGVMRWPQAPGYFTPKDDPDHNLWFARGHLAIAASNGWGDVAPFYVDLESPAPPGGLPSPGMPTVALRNEHLQYAITWYGLAAVVSIMFGYWLASHRRSKRGEASL